MKKLTLLAITACLFTASTCFADFQSPPGDRYDRVRKLSRAVGNILYGINELPTTWARTTKEEGSVYGASIGIVNGTYRTLVRAGWGVFEFATFPFRTHKGSFRPGYKNIWWDLNHGYHELAPELGFQSKFGTARMQNW